MKSELGRHYRIPRLRSLRLRLFLIFVAIGAGAMGVAVWGFLTNLGEIDVAARRRLVGNVRAIQNIYLERELHAQAHFWRVFGNRSALLDDARCPAILKAEFRTTPEVVNAGLVDPQGRITCSILPVPTDHLELSGNPYFNAAFNSQEIVRGGFFIGTISKRPVMLLTARVKLDNSNKDPVAFLSIQTSGLHALAKNHGLSKTDALTLLNSQGDVVATWPSNADVVGKHFNFQKTPGSTFDIHGLPRTSISLVHIGDEYYGIGPVAGFGYVVLRSTQSTLYGTSYKNFLTNSLIAALLVLAGGVFIWRLFMVPVIRRSHLLRTVANALTHGDSEARTGMKTGRDDLDEVGYAFDKMADSLGERASQLEEKTRQIQANRDRLEKLNRIHRILTSVSRMLVGVQDKNDLFRDVCRLAVDQGLFSAVWISRISDDRTKATSVAWAGQGAEYLEDFVLNVDTLPDREGIVGRALTNEAPAISNDFVNDPRLSTWKEIGMRLKYGAGAAFPIVHEGRITYMLSAYAEKSFFDDEVLSLLESLVGDIEHSLRRITAESKADFLATHDTATGLANVRNLEDKLEALIQRDINSDQATALLCIEVSNYEKIIDDHGLAVGADVIRKISQNVESGGHDRDLIARVSGNRIGVALTNVRGIQNLDRMVRRITDALPGKIVAAKEQVFPTYRCGVSISPNDADSAEELLGNSQRACVRADPGSVRFFEKNIDTEAQEVRRLELALRSSLQAKKFVLHYQPIIDVEKMQIAGFEALARWPEGPDGEPVPPVRFIPILESADLIPAFGQWVLEEAASQAARWADKGHDNIYLAANVSALQLQEPTFSDNVRKALEEAGDLGANRLMLEITESMLLEPRSDTRQHLDQLQEMGVRLVLDDFGTGYSSLSYLHTLPFTVLKIDKSFVATICDSSRSMALVKTIMSFGEALNLQIIAEGIETAKHKDLMQQLGCRYMQGFYFAKPMTAEDAEELLGNCDRFT